jgi:hypothetical protein
MWFSFNGVKDRVNLLALFNLSWSTPCDPSCTAAADDSIRTRYVSHAPRNNIKYVIIMYNVIMCRITSLVITGFSGPLEIDSLHINTRMYIDHGGHVYTMYIIRVL